MKELTHAILSGCPIDRSVGNSLLNLLAPLRISPAQAASYLTLLAARPPTPELVEALADGLLTRAARPAVLDSQLCARSVDIVGTGGDGAGTMNISTCAAILLAACGVPVVKHGNRAVSSQTGSADVLAALGMPMPPADSDAKTSLEQTNFCFLFAPYYHTAAADLAPVRRELAAIGIVTVFNILGPLVNPARPPFGVFGAYNQNVAVLMAGALRARTTDGTARYFVVCGEPVADGLGGTVTLDEATPLGPFVLHIVARGQVVTQTIDPIDFGINRCTLDDLRGGDATHNAAMVRALFVNSNPASAAVCGPTQGLRDAVILSAALGLEVAGHCRTFAEAIAVARQTLDTGTAGRALMAMQHCWNTFASTAANRQTQSNSGGVCRG